MRCPSCSTDLGDLDPRWAPWCEGCGWGVDHLAPEARLSRFDRWWRGRLNAVSAREHERLLTHGLADGPSRDRAIVLLLCSLLHLVTLMLAVALVMLLLSSAWVGAKIFLGLVGVGMLVLLLPPLRGAESEGEELTREGAPHLWSLVDEIAAKAGAQPPDRIRVASTVNATWGREGWGHTRVLTLGYPLWAAIEGQAKVALLGHEIGHEVNNDLLALRYVGAALHALSEWREALTPQGLRDGESPYGLVVALAQSLAIVLLLPVVALLLMLESRIDELAARSHQYAEHLADDLGAALAGKEGALALETELLDPSILEFALRVPFRSSSDVSVWETARAHLAAVPDSERRRQLRQARETLQSVDASHPPTFRRLELLQAGPARQPTVLLPPAREDLVDGEIRTCEPWVRRRIAERASAAF